MLETLQFPQSKLHEQCMQHIQALQHSSQICKGQTIYSPHGWTGHPRHISNYEHFNRSSFNIHDWSWNYRGCWHQTCPPIGTRHACYMWLIPITKHVCPVLLVIVTTSLCQNWVICAPAAFLRCGSRFSCSLSGIEP